MVPLILIFCPSWEWSGTRTGRFISGCRRLGGLQNRSGRFG